MTSRLRINRRKAVSIEDAEIAAIIERKQVADKIREAYDKGVFDATEQLRRNTEQRLKNSDDIVQRRSADVRYLLDEIERIVSTFQNEYHTKMQTAGQVIEELGKRIEELENSGPMGLVKRRSRNGKSKSIRKTETSRPKQFNVSSRSSSREKRSRNRIAKELRQGTGTDSEDARKRYTEISRIRSRLAEDIRNANEENRRTSEDGGSRETPILGFSGQSGRSSVLREREMASQGIREAVKNARAIIGSIVHEGERTREIEDEEELYRIRFD